MKIDGGQQGTTFSQIYDKFEPGKLSNRDQHLRLTGNNLHTHNPLMPHGRAEAAMTARQAKYDGAAAAVKDAIAREHGREVADKVFRNLNLKTEGGHGIVLGGLHIFKRVYPLDALTDFCPLTL